MNRQASYADASANPYAASQMQMQQISAQRIQQNAAMSNFPGRLNSLPAEHGNNSGVPSQMQQIPAQRFQHNAAMSNFPGHIDSLPAEQGNNSRGPSLWDRDASIVSNSKQMPTHPYTDPRKGGNSIQSYHQRPVLDSKSDFGNHVNTEIGPQAHEEDMEIGYEDKPSHLNFEGLEERFQEEILKLIKEQIDAENAENARHREKIMEINNKYQEKLSVLRAQQANRREEFLRRESQARLQQYQQAGMNYLLDRTGPNNPHGHVPAVPPQPYPTGHMDRINSYSQSPFPGVGGNRGTEGRVPYPQGRVYNNASGRS
ncbi:unnamed protein product [Fraxinus pennsylvanica]|uniref:Uncharacterized protein n=1 Tax=Fraxinus pennsylvanica TaxID=56036 RepID=A0AAD2DZ31_9LAMI|nr:unnamed protein product [Fraxinus pennsylvanica]